MRILVIQNTSPSLPGVVGQVLADRGADLVLNCAETGDRPPADDAGFDGLVVLGGPMNAEEDHLWPHLGLTARLIRRFHDQDKPFLGICLGSQLAARAFGNKVHRMGAVERGFRHLTMMPAAASDRLLGGLGPAHLFQWHEDTFDLPDDAVLLMTGAECRNQAFRVGAATYAFQCHIEVTPELWRHWYATSADYLAKVDPGFADRVAREMPRHFGASRDFCVRVTDRWADLVAERRQPPRAAAGA
ncbi:MAG: type 1 glutamine amidotransferase [Alphaproteobacteria bacterium]